MTNKEAAKLLKNATFVIARRSGKRLCFEALVMAIKALENERPRGKWINREANCNTSFPFWERYECPFCHKYSGYSSFCQHCGADMMGGQDNDPN